MLSKPLLHLLGTRTSYDKEILQIMC